MDFTRRRFLLAMGGLLGAAACNPGTPAVPTTAPAAQPQPTSAGAPAANPTTAPVAQPTPQAQTAPATTGGAKTIVVGQGFEITGLGWIGRVDTEATHVAQAGLVTRDSENYRAVPWMAQELPSMDNGTWKVNPDGTMETVYKLRPGITWHDGTPLSSKDFVFGYQLTGDPNIKVTNPKSAGDHISGFDTPDDTTLVVKWKDRFPGANSLFATQLPPMPRHLLEESFKAGKFDEINNSSYWNKNYVQAGAFKVVDFVPGDHVEFAANDRYFLGRPKVDRIIWRIIPDSNTLLAAVLANEVDVTTRAALTIETGIIADREWASKGQGTVRFSPAQWTWLGPSATSPIFGWDAPNQNLIRQAMLHAIDRQAIVEALFAGKEQALDFPLSPVRPAYKDAQSAVRVYAYDPSRAQQLLDQAGWRRGGDGVRVNDAGERFSVPFRTTAGRKDQEQVQAAIADNLKAVGIETKIENFPDRVMNDEDHRNHWPGLSLDQHSILVEDWLPRFGSRSLPTAANHWLGQNQSGWTNPRKDEIIDGLDSTLDENERNAMIVEWLTLFTQDLPFLPIKYNAEPTSYRSNIKNVPVRVETGGDNYRTWNVHLWDKTD
jgi:peptide/nickel transport system substrate-binding protein